MNLESAVNDHGAILSFEASRAGEIILGEIKKELAHLKDNADADTVAELKRIKGYKEGLKFVLNEIEKVKRIGELAKSQVDKQKEREARSKGPIDSSTL